MANAWSHPLTFIKERRIVWSGIVFDSNEIVNQALSLINQFMPFVYIIGGITVFALVMLVIIVLAKKAVG